MEIKVIFPQSGYPTPRRRWPRYRLESTVRVTTRRRGKVVAVDGCASQINDGGLTVMADIGLYLCEHVLLEIASPEGMPLRMNCVVRNRRGYHYGLEFLACAGNSDESRTFVAALLGGVRSRV
jgi:hypothetical protein